LPAQGLIGEIPHSVENLSLLWYHPVVTFYQQVGKVEVWVEIFFTDYHQLTECSPNEQSLVEALRSAGVPDRMPFLLASDGSYDLQLNRFLRELPHNGVRSWHSWKSYALDLLTWCRFLQEHRGTTVWKATRADLIVYHQARRGGLAPLSSDPTPDLASAASISAASWNRTVAALDKFYQWAREEGYVSTLPFTYREAHSLHGYHLVTVRRNTAFERAARHQEMKFLTMDAYLFFRDVGLRGRLPSGAEDAAFCGRNGERNAAFAELLITTGLRLTEANSLVLPEVPALREPVPKSVPFLLAPATAKGQKGRKISMPTRIVRQITSYCEIERANAIARGQQRGVYERWPHFLRVVQASRRTWTVQVGDETTTLLVSRLTPQVRRSALLCRADGTVEAPMNLWLTEHGTPMTSDNWEAIFAQASARCCRLGYELYVTPHMLRHTFAVHMLAQLIRAQIGVLFERPADDPSRRADAYRRLAGDPLRTLQKLLGHATITSTYIYLDNVLEAQALIDDALDRYAGELVPSLER
jgi:site-specific recombinase XerD